jgi:hypothetical protein
MPTSLTRTATLLLTAVLLLPVVARAGEAHRYAVADQDPEEICEALPNDVPIEQSVLGGNAVYASSQTAQRWTWDASRAAAASSDRDRR